MFEKIRKFLKKTPKEHQLSAIDMDEKILRCFVLYSERIDRSSAANGPCIYIYVKPGHRSFSKNIDFVKEVYSLNNIKLNKHVSHLDNKETEVLYISAKSYVEDLNDKEKQFLKRTAPEVNNLSDYKWSKEGKYILERTQDINVKIGIESGQINPKHWEGPIRLPYRTR